MANEIPEIRKFGVDISEHNGIINFEDLKDEVDFVMIRATYGRKGIDKMMKRNLEECKRLKIPFGFYLYSYALNLDQAKEEVSFFLKTINEYKIDIQMPCVIDMEDGDGYKKKNGMPDNETLCDIVLYEANQIAMAGMLPMCYASSSWFQSKLNNKKLDSLLKWIAWWNVEEEKIDKSKFSIWQNSSKKHVKGIDGNVDYNVAFQDFPAFIRYTTRYLKIVNIKENTGIEDITIQFFRLYKNGEELINKLYERFKKPKIKKIEASETEKWQIIMQEFELELQDVEYLTKYLYNAALCIKLFNSILEGDQDGLGE